MRTKSIFAVSALSVLPLFTCSSIPEGNQPIRGSQNILAADLNSWRLSKLGESLARDDPDNAVLSFEMALFIVEHEAEDNYPLTAEQKQLIEIVRDLCKTEMGRDLLVAAKQEDVWISVDERVLDVLGVYSDTPHKYIRVITQKACASSEDEEHESAEQPLTMPRSDDSLLRTAFHEVTHANQYEVWGSSHLKLPHNTPSFDVALWRLFEEAQADMYGHIGVELTKNGKNPLPTKDACFEYFVNDVVNDSSAHAKRYKFFDSTLDYSFAPVEGFEDALVLAFIGHFGRMPDQEENFLEGRVETYQDILELFVFPNEKYHEHYEALLAENMAPVPQLTPAAAPGS